MKIKSEQSEFDTFKDDIEPVILRNGDDISFVVNYINDSVQNKKDRIFFTPKFMGIIINDNDRRATLSKTLNMSGINTKLSSEFENTLLVPASKNITPQALVSIVQDYYSHPVVMWQDGQQSNIAIMQSTQTSIVASNLRYAFEQNSGIDTIAISRLPEGKYQLQADYDTLKQADIPISSLDYNGTATTIISDKETLRAALDKINQVVGDMNRLEPNQNESETELCVVMYHSDYNNWQTESLSINDLETENIEI